MSLRIGIDGTPLLGQRSGVGYYTSHLLEALLETNPEWEYLLYSNRPLNGLEPSLAGVTRIEDHFPHSRWVWMQTMLPGAIRRSHPDLVHFTNALAPLWQPAPFVLTVHDASLFVYGHYHPRARHLTIRMMLPLVARRASAIITVSQHSCSELTRVLRLPPEKLYVVYEAPAPHFRPVEDKICLASLRKKYDLPEEFILFVGTLEPRKNLARLVRALAHVRRHGLPHHLVLAGPTGWMTEEFYGEVESLGLKDVVHHLGYVPGDELPGLFSLATLFAFPSLYEGFGLPPLEAMACGTPVLTSNRSSMAEVCGDAAYLVEPESEESIAEGLCTLLGDSDLRQMLCRRGLAHAAQFSWERAARETGEIYRRVVSGSGS